jgi:Acetyltransferases, including N-acetylases of ribosomal proteins
MSITFREVESSDIPALARIRAAESQTEQYWIDRITGYLDGTHNPQKALPPRILYVAQQDDSMIGFISGHLTERFQCAGELQWINVVERQRGGGAAGALFNLLATWFEQQKALRICVNCSPENPRAYCFYTRHGAVPMNDHWLIWEDIRQRPR